MLITHSIEEALFLSHRVVVLTNRPTSVRQVIDVDVPWPRTPESRLAPAFLDLRRHLEGVLREMTPRPNHAVERHLR
jgi:NitT/TauT family transport system ATP-binding protein